MFSQLSDTPQKKLSCTVAPNYVPENSWEVLFRLNASVWKDVLPWCLANTAIAAAIRYSNDDRYAQMISSNDKGHAFMSLAVSYLLITRTSICLNRYMTQRTGLSNLMKSCRELVSYSISFTRFKHKEENDVKWRRSIAKRTISVLKVIVAVMKYPSSHRHVWEVEEIEEEDRLAMDIAVGKSNERSPLVLAMFLRSVIFSHLHKLSTPLEIPQELQLLQLTTDIMTAYGDIMQYMTTPYPFPLVQMTRTILFFYIFTLPFALATDIQQTLPYILIIFIITYGFVGLELISIEIDDPFGQDPNDFDVGSMAKIVYQDIAIFIKDVDGQEAANEIKKSIDSGVKSNIENTVKNHGQFSRVLAWVNKTGNSGRNFLVIDHIADELHGIYDDEDESKDKSIEIGSRVLDSANNEKSISHIKEDSNAPKIRDDIGSEEQVRRRRNTLEGSSRLMEQLAISVVSRLETVHSNESMDFPDDLHQSSTDSSIKYYSQEVQKPMYDNQHCFLPQSQVQDDDDWDLSDGSSSGSISCAGSSIHS